MPAGKPQPISGVSAGYEALIETLYPSISASVPGRLIGMLCDCLPISIAGIKLSHVLFAPLMLPFGLIGYLQLKVTGKKYVLTNRNIQIWKAIGARRLASVSLGDIDEIAIQVEPGQSFYHAGNLVLLKANGDPLLTLPGVPRPERLRHLILESRDARRQSDASFATIEARQPQPA